MASRAFSQVRLMLPQPTSTADRGAGFLAFFIA
jgi:hypothetical protein